ncbi:GNAT family N-acetyltransferase [Celeribacter halophilus]|uniref:Acetyltransferase (GNAT) domain-containing protein n=1 Tax=Celeribacter halophilus TaxID=576117 RepID=A0A1I3UIW8_9RHOB|nr:GNAT family N-acetyltransferase [Celeribacter halophilus]PZX10444.1 acetyltransferase (GNAT) family protein [Celeribacter halophilus]SFJ81786.1 Acetyltransferase (GNAT) domain-containing protein [Celeribacter halophilus]
MLECYDHDFREPERPDSSCPLPSSLSEALAMSAQEIRKSVPFTVRAAMPADTAEIDTLFRASYGLLLKQDYPAEILDAALPALLQTAPRLLNCGTFFVAETGGGEILGAGGWTQASPFGGVGPREIGHMRRVAVHPDYVRRGIGSALIDHILDNARLTGVKRMCSLSTLTAQAFYAAHGFTASGDVDLALRPGVYLPAVQMALDL